MTPDNAQTWTEDYAFKHLRETFNKAFREHPELMEPYVNRLATDDQSALTKIMREGLRDTFNQRYPKSGG